MATTTITEALAEIKTIHARIAKKREFVLANIARQEMQKDPLAGQGGTEAVLKRELQAVSDLQTRLVKIRAAINEANRSNTISLGVEAGISWERTIADWITWKREIAPQRKEIWDAIDKQVQSVRNQALSRGVRLVERGTPEKDTDIVLHVDVQTIANQREQLEEVLGKLDGALSLKNATITIEIT